MVQKQISRACANFEDLTGVKMSASAMIKLASISVNNE